MNPLYQAFGRRIFDEHTSTYLVEGRDVRGTEELLRPVLAELGLPEHHVAALDDTSLDAEIQAETDESPALTGRDVGTPIIHVEPPTGVAFLGPVISRLPDDADALDFWDHVVGLAIPRLRRAQTQPPRKRLSSRVSASTSTSTPSANKKTCMVDLGGPSIDRSGNKGRASTG